MQWIQLSNDPRFFCVDDEDYDKVKPYTWHLSNNKRCILAKVNGTTIPLARFILGVLDPKIWVDHKDRDIFNNCRLNLREGSAQESSFNRKYKEGTSRFKGVSRRKGRFLWRAKLCKNGIDVLNEYFFNEIDAAKAYDRAAKKYFGKFAVLNFPDDDEK